MPGEDEVGSTLALGFDCLIGLAGSTCLPLMGAMQARDDLWAAIVESRSKGISFSVMQEIER